MKRIFGLVQLKNAIVWILFPVLFFSACATGNDSVTGNPELTPYCDEIYVSDGYLYYGGPKRNPGLFAYNLETKEKVEITAQQGTLLKTDHGFFYHIGMKIYQINEFSLELLCVIPKGTQFVDYVQGEIYWIENRKKLCVWNTNLERATSGECVKVLYCELEDKSQILWAKIAKEGGYLARWDGLYFLDFKTEEIKCIQEGFMYGLAQSLEGEILFLYSNEDRESFYMVDLRNYEVKKIADTTTDFALLHDETVFYNGSGTMAYDLRDGSSRRLGDMVWSGAVAYYDHYLIMRHWAMYNIYLFDIIDGTCERIIDM